MEGEFVRVRNKVTSNTKGYTYESVVEVQRPGADGDAVVAEALRLQESAESALRAKYGSSA